MFQNEFRDTISLLVNVLVAIVIITFISSVFGLKNRIGATQSAQNLSEKKLTVREEYHRIDDKVLLADEVRAYFAESIKDGIIVYYAIDSNNNGYLDEGETFYSWTYSDYIKDKKAYTASELGGVKNGNTFPKAVRHDETYGALASSGAITLQQEIGANKNTRYLAKIIYDNNDPILQEKDSHNIMKDRTISKKSEVVTGVLFLKTSVAGVNRFHGVSEG